MNLDEFWKIIENSRAKASRQSPDGNMEMQARALQAVLTKLPKSELESFNHFFQQAMDKSYTWDLWGAAYIINGGCSDDGFEYFRRWLISMGRATYENAVKDPESLLTSVDDPSVEDFSFEEFGVSGLEAMESKKDSSSVPQGSRWKEDDSDLKDRFPKIWARFNKKPSESEPWWKHPRNTKVETHRKRAYQFSIDLEDPSKSLPELISLAHEVDPAIIYLLMKFKKIHSPNAMALEQIKKVLDADSSLHKTVQACKSDSYIEAFLNAHDELKGFRDELEFLCSLTESLES